MRGIIDGALKKISGLFYSAAGENFSDYYYSCYGYLTNDKKRALLYVNLPKEWGRVTITKLLAEVRMSTGGYLGGSSGVNLTSNLTSYSKRKSDHTLVLQLDNSSSSGWGGTNNTPLVGLVGLTGTIFGGGAM